MLLAHVIELVRGRGAVLVNVDATVLAQAPTLAPHLPEMAKRLADALGIPVDASSVKARARRDSGLAGPPRGHRGHGRGSWSRKWARSSAG